MSPKKKLRKHVSRHVMCRNLTSTKLQVKKMSELRVEAEQRVDQRTAREQQQGGKLCPVLHKGGEGEGGVRRKTKMSSDVAVVMKSAANDWRQERKGREVVKECALFIPADTSESLIHLEKGISQVRTYLLAFTQTHTRWHTMSASTHNCKWPPGLCSSRL